MEYWLLTRIGVQMAGDNSAALCVVRWLPSLRAGYQSTKRRITWEKKLYSLRRRSRMSMRIQMNCVLNSQHLIPINIPSRSWDSPREVCLNYDSNKMFRRKMLGTIQWFGPHPRPLICSDDYIHQHMSSKGVITTSKAPWVCPCVHEWTTPNLSHINTSYIWNSFNLQWFV